MKPFALLIAATLSACATAGSGETIHSEDIYLRYTLQDAGIFAAAGGPLVVYGAPNGGASPEAVAAAMRLPSYLTPNQLTAVPQGTEGHRLMLVFAPQSAVTGRSVCKGEVNGGVAGAHTKVLAVFCRGEHTVLGEATLEADGAFGPGQPGFRTAMSRLIRTVMPLRSPFDEGEQGCRRRGC